MCSFSGHFWSDGDFINMLILWLNIVNTESRRGIVDFNRRVKAEGWF
jgi:hypothetical protein